MDRVTIYTDGACSHNPGPGGWGCVLIYGKHRKEASGSAENTTNNRMELTAAIEEFLDGLAKVDRVIFVSRYYLSESYRDIAEKTGLSEKNISVKLTRMRAKLKDHLLQKEIRV